MTSPRNWPVGERAPRTEVFYDLPIADVCRLYAACRLVVLPVKDNSYSFATTTAFDAMALGKPVVVTKTRAVGSNGDGYSLIDGVHCRFVPPGDAAALADAIDRLWRSPGEREALGKAGRQWARDHSSAAFAGELACALEYAIGPHPTGAPRE